VLALLAILLRLALLASLLKLTLLRFILLAMLLRFALLAFLLWLTVLAVLLILAVLAARLLRLALLAILLSLALLPVLLVLALLAILLMLALLTILLRFAFVKAAAGTASALLRPVDLAALLLTVLPSAVAPALVAAARDEPAHGLDHAEVVVSVLPVGLSRDPVARGGRFARQCLVLVEDLVGIAAHAHIGTAAIENLISIGRAVRIVTVLLLMLIVATATAASTTAAATRPLPIVWSH
jgi:hypothetical protein